MSQQRTCSYGHQWQSDDAASTCPVCASSGDIFSDSASVTPGSLDELPPPPEPQQPASDQTLAMPNTWEAQSARSGDRYRILRPHARGGLGEVFLAEDTELGRKVALKEIQANHADLPESRTRFVLEAEVTGRLEHPGVVPVYGLGTYPDGRPFYAMRFVQGDSLRGAIRRFHTGTPRFDSLAFRELLTRFVAVCQAVAYAHSRGVLHRDLKPENVMLGKYGETYVVDWGLAKVVGRAQSDSGRFDSEKPLPSGSHPSGTAIGQALGTPTYMSPEQAAGRLDEIGPASDVYGLGATLYAVLTGKAPFAGEYLQVILEEVCAGRLSPPRQVAPAVPRALDAVCRKAMALRPADRYPTAQALAKDVERWLADQPVSAWREPMLVRLRRWMKRHRMLVTGLAVTVLVGLASLSVATVLLSAANERERTARERAVVARNRTRDVLDVMVSGVTGDSLATQKAVSPEQREFLEKVLAYYQDFAAEPGEDRQARERLAKARRRLGLIHYRLGQKEAGVTVFREATELLGQLAVDFPTVADYRRDLALSQHSLGVLLDDLGKLTDAESAFRAAVALLDKLAADFPAIPDYRHHLAASHNDLGVSLGALGKRADAESAYRSALAILDPLTKESPDVPEYRSRQGLSYNNLGHLLYQQGKKADAETACVAAVTILEKLATDFPRVPEYRDRLATSYGGLGTLLVGRGKTTEGEAAYRRMLALFEKLATDFPSAPDYRSRLGTSLASLAGLLMNSGRLIEAEAAYRQALDVHEKLATEFPALPRCGRDLARTLNDLGVLFIRAGKPQEAEASFRRQLATVEKLTADFPSVIQYQIQLADSYLNLSTTSSDRGEHELALDWFAKVIRTLEPVLQREPHHSAGRKRLLTAYSGRAEALAKLGRHAEALSDWDRALASDDGSTRTKLLFCRAYALARADQPANAAAQADLLLPMLKDAGEVYDAACVLAQASAAAKDDTADRLAARAVAVLRQALARGFADIPHLLRDTDLDPIRRRDDYFNLVWDLAETRPPSAPANP